MKGKTKCTIKSRREYRPQNTFKFGEHSRLGLTLYTGLGKLLKSFESFG